MAQAAQRRTPRDRRRRFRRRLAAVLGYVVLVTGFAWYLESRLPTTVVFVRHAEVERDGTDDPELSLAGRQRAEELADFVQDIDVVSSINAVYASEFRRTQETAAPIARRLGLDVQVADQSDIEDFMAEVQHRHRGEIILIVSHSNLIGPLVAELHGHQSVPEIAEDEFDNFYIVTVPLYGKVKTLRLHYGDRERKGTGMAPNMRSEPH
jgi:broad specificity phosphatase PhoE